MLHIPNALAETLYAVFVGRTGEVWDGTGMDATAANAAGVLLANAAGTQLASLTKPAGLPDDIYSIHIYARLGASVSLTTDPVRAVLTGWDSRETSVAAAVEEVRADIQGAKAGLTPQAQGLRPMAATTDVVDATNAAPVDVACPPATTHVFVSCTGAFRFKRSAGAGASDTYMAAGAYLLDMQCPGTAGVFSVLVVSGDATEVHVTPMGP